MPNFSCLGSPEAELKRGRLRMNIRFFGYETRLGCLHGDRNWNEGGVVYWASLGFSVTSPDHYKYQNYVSTMSDTRHAFVGPGYYEVTYNTLQRGGAPPSRRCPRPLAVASTFSLPSPLFAVAGAPRARRAPAGLRPFQL